MILDQLSFWIDHDSRTAAGQMALDEALFRTSQSQGIAFLRIYQFASPSITIGYFDKCPENESRPVVRRITGGGLVEHGEDVTICLTIPPDSPLARQPTSDRYQFIHKAIAESLQSHGFPVSFEQNALQTKGPCFSNPVQWDLLDQLENKIAGGAQRKSKGAVIHQGSLFLPEMFRFEGEKIQWTTDLAESLSKQWSCPERRLIEEITEMAQNLEKNQYKNDKWNKKR